jgi:hypothetical protein
MFTQRNDYLTSEEVAHFKVKADKTRRHHEAFTIFTDIQDNNLVVNLVWDFTRVSFVLETRATQITLNSLRNKIKKGQLKAADEFAHDANFLAYNYHNLGYQVKDTALLLINKAIELESQEGRYYGIKRNIFWFSKDLNGVEKTTDEWIRFHQNRKAEGYGEDIQLLKDELTWLKKSLPK